MTAVIGMGASPGVSNLLAAAAAAPLDSVRDVYTGAAGRRDSRKGRGRPRPTDRPGRVTDRRGRALDAAEQRHHHRGAGRLADRTTAAAARDARAPGGRRGTAYTVGHPEPVTLQRTLKPTGESANLMVISPSALAYLEVLRRGIDGGRLTNETAARRIAKPDLPGIIRSLPRALTTRARAPCHPSSPRRSAIAAAATRPCWPTSTRRPASMRC